MDLRKRRKKGYIADAGFHSWHFYNATAVATAFRALGIGYATTRENRYADVELGSVASELDTLTARPPRLRKASLRIMTNYIFSMGFIMIYLKETGTSLARKEIMAWAPTGLSLSTISN